MEKSRNTLLILVPIALVAVGIGIWLFSFRPSASRDNDDGNTARTTSGNSERRENAELPRHNFPRDNSEAPIVNAPANEPTNKPPDNPPVENGRPKVKRVPVRAPELDWGLSKAACGRIAKDVNATKEQRAEAQSRLFLDFTEWPGRETQRLGGFAFIPTDYGELNGFKVLDDRTQVLTNGVPPNVMLERVVKFIKTTGQLTVKIRVMASRHWAQRYFLSWIAPPSAAPGLPVLGKDQGIFVGDVCQGYAEDKAQTSGEFTFVRHNVAVRLELIPLHSVDGPPVEMNLIAFAQRMDGVIRSQSMDAKDWDALDKNRPMIDEFAIEADELEQVTGKSRSPVSCVVHHPLEQKVSLVSVAEEGGLTLTNKDGRPVAALIALGGKYEARTYKAWLIAYDDSLLFSVAEASVMVKPK